MSREHDLPSESDDSDVDYVPDGAEEEAKSEIESDGDPESEGEEANGSDSRKRHREAGKSKTKKKNKHSRVNKRARVMEDEQPESGGCEGTTSQQQPLTEAEEKKRADLLWADFMKDTKTAPRPSRAQEPARCEQSKSVAATSTSTDKDKVKVTRVYEFAGEVVKVDEEVAKDSIEASSGSTADSRGALPRRSAAGGGGIASVLGQLGKKSKLSTLTKSKLDWDSFKKQENLEEEISTHNRGKDGYLERQDFLQRADLRQFELEKQLRNTTRRTAR